MLVDSTKLAYPGVLHWRGLWWRGVGAYLRSWAGVMVPIPPVRIFWRVWREVWNICKRLRSRNDTDLPTTTDQPLNSRLLKSNKEEEDQPLSSQKSIRRPPLP